MLTLLSPQVESTFQTLKYVTAFASALGLVWAVFKLVNSVTTTFQSLQLFLKEQVPTISASISDLKVSANAATTFLVEQVPSISGSISDLKKHADLAMSNHLPHLQIAAESIADEMKQQTRDFREHQLNQIEIQTEVKTELRSLNERLK